jgi:Winged helix-turn helix
VPATPTYRPSQQPCPVRRWLLPQQATTTRQAQGRRSRGVRCGSGAPANRPTAATPWFRDRQAFERIHLQAGALFAAGRSQIEGAHQLGVSRQNVSRWHTRWRAGRQDALRSAGSTGPASRLSDQQLHDSSRRSGTGLPNPDCSPPFTNQIKAVRCDARLTSCTAPILISGAQNSLQFRDVTIGPDGRVYVTWEEDNDLANNFEPPERMRFWLRVAEPGSTTFGPLRQVANEPLNLGIADLHANDFRVATYPKNTVAMVHGRPRVFVVWDGCRARTFGDTVCEEPAIKLRYSDDAGVTWSRTQVLSVRGDNYFPTIDTDPATGRVAVAWYTTRFDPVFHNRQDVELVSLNSVTPGGGAAPAAHPAVQRPGGRSPARRDLHRGLLRGRRQQRHRLCPLQRQLRLDSTARGGLPHSSARQLPDQTSLVVLIRRRARPWN